MNDMATLATRRQRLEGLGEFNVSFHGLDKFLREIELARLPRWPDAACGVTHRFHEVGPQHGRQGPDARHICEPDHVGVACVRALSFKHASRVGQQRSVEEAQTHIAAKRTQYRYVAAGVRNTGVPT